MTRSWIRRNASGELVLGRLKLADLVGVLGGVAGLLGAGVVAAQTFWPYQLSFQGPEQIELRCYPNEPSDDGLVRCNDKSNLTLTAMSLSYLNTGNPAKTPVIVSEVARVILPKRAIELHWQWFANTNDESLGQSGVGLFGVGASGTAHWTQFLPRTGADKASRYINYYSWDEFMADVAASKASGTPIVLRVTFLATVLGESSPRTTECSVELDERAIELWLTPGNDLFQRRFPCHA